MRFLLFAVLHSSFLVTAFAPPSVVTSRSASRNIALFVAQELPQTTSYEDDVEARSAFGTREYWDDIYSGMGDFPKDEYSWYYGYDVIKPHLNRAVPNKDKVTLLLPGIGNDPLLLDLFGNGYKNLVAFDYSEHAIERQRDLLEYQPSANVELHQMDARFLKDSWTGRFDAVLEKGALDAIYLSGDGNVEASIRELDRVLKPGGFIISVSGVVPAELRRELFADYEWIRDGTDDMQAGCFVFQKLYCNNTSGSQL